MSGRAEIRLSPAEQDEWLRRGHTMILSTLGRDGYPHSVAMWYVLINGQICFSTYGKAQKTVNVQRNPHVACLLEEGRTYDSLRGLMIRGTAEVDADHELNARIQLGLFTKYAAEADAEVSPDVEAVIRQQARKRVAIKVTPVKVASWDHAKRR